MTAYYDEIVCDLAETYHIYDMGEHPLDLVARLVFGLRDNSRLKMKLNNCQYSTTELLLGRLFDVTNVINWKLGANKSAPPESLFDAMLGKKKEKKQKNVLFNSMEEFEKARQEIIEGSKT